MEIRSEPSSNVGAPKSPPSSPLPSAQNASTELSNSQASHGFTVIAEDSGVKRKRGRPRRYTPDDETPLQGAGSSSGFTGLPSAARLETKKKKKNKNVAWGKKIQMKALGLSGIGFTPHVIIVKTGEDVSTEIMSFSNQGSRAVCVLSANGTISNVALHQAASSSGTVAYEGQFEILSLSGSFSPSESSGQPNRTGGLSVSLADPDGHVIGGGVAGVLVAATPVQVVVGSFIPKGGGSRRKEPLQPLIHPAGESEPEKLTQGGFQGPSSPISFIPKGGGGGHKEPLQPLIHPAGESEPEKPTQGGIPGPSSPTSFIPKGSGGGRKEPLQPLIHPVGESEPEKPTQGGFPGPSSPISFIPKGSGGGLKEPLQPLIHPAGESEPEKPTQGGFPGPSSPISRGASNPSSPHNQSTNGDNHNGNNNQGIRFLQWK